MCFRRFPMRLFSRRQRTGFAKCFLPGAAAIDRVKKMPLYAQYGVSHAWLVDPIAKTLDVFRLENERWVLLKSFANDDRARAEPFDAIEIELGVLWARWRRF